MRAATCVAATKGAVRLASITRRQDSRPCVANLAPRNANTGSFQISPAALISSAIGSPAGIASASACRTSASIRRSTCRAVTPGGGAASNFRSSARTCDPFAAKCDTSARPRTPPAPDTTTQRSSGVVMGSGGLQQTIDIFDRLQLLDVILRQFAAEEFLQTKHQPNALERIPSLDLRQQDVAAGIETLVRRTSAINSRACINLPRVRSRGGRKTSLLYSSLGGQPREAAWPIFIGQIDGTRKCPLMALVRLTRRHRD